MTDFYGFVYMGIALFCVGGIAVSNHRNLDRVEPSP